VKLPSDGEIRDRLTAILADPEFRGPDEPAWWTTVKKAWYALVDALDRLSPVARWAILLGALAVLAAIVLHTIATFRRLLRDAPRTRDGRAERKLAREPTCEELLAEARALRAGGQLRQAARALQQARLLLECRRRSLAWRPTLADWEWIDQLGRPAALVDFTRATQRLAFGADPSPREVEACEARPA
jgi:hypothetical protein